MAKLFVSYRRDDDANGAARLGDALAKRFGRSSVFMDVDHLIAGEKFDAKLAKALDACDVLIAVIGPRWMDILRARIAAAEADHEERDYVREEIAAALKRGIVVIPVRVGRDGALPLLPRPSELPADIRELVAHQKHDVRHESHGRDAKDLADAIVKVRRAAGGSWSRTAAVAGGAVAIIALIYIAAGLFGRPVWWPGGSVSNTSRTSIAAIEKADNEAFAVAERRGALDGYGEYLGKFPNGQHVTVAKERIAYLNKLNGEMARLSATGTRAELEAFAAKNPGYKPRVGDVLAARDAVAEQAQKEAEARAAEAKRKADAETKRLADEKAAREAAERAAHQKREAEAAEAKRKADAEAMRLAGLEEERKRAEAAEAKRKVAEAERQRLAAVKADQEAKSKLGPQQLLTGSANRAIDELRLKLQSRQESNDQAGVAIAEVERGSDAELKGLKSGDRILEVNGQAVSSANDVPAGFKKASDEGRRAVLLRILSGDQKRFVAVQLTSLRTIDKLQLKLQSRHENNDQAGVAIAEVEGGSDPELKGLKSGDRILEVNGQAVSSAYHVAAGVNKASDEGRRAVLLRILSGDQKRFVAIQIK